MKKTLRKWWGNYIYIGVLLAMPMALSYFYQLANMIMHMGAPGTRGFYPLFVAFLWCFLNPFTRAVLWLPSLVVWATSGGHQFLHWLAPGFFETTGVWHIL